MFKLSDIKKELPLNIQKGMWNGHLKNLLNDKDRYKIDFDVYLPSKGMNLQRPLCWTLEQKRELIKSVIKGVDIQNFYVIIYTPDDKQRVYKIIDGKQRLSTLISFCNDEFTFEFNGQEYLYSELSADVKDVIDRFDIHFNQTYEYWDDLIPDDVKIDWFEQINFLGTPQDTEHINNLKKSHK
jgi:hypothetical protein